MLGRDSVQWWNKIAPLSTAGVLDLFSSCLAILLQASAFDVTILRSIPLLKNRALCEILLKQGVHIRSATDVFPVPFKTLTETVTSLGIRLPPWCLEMGTEERQSLIDAIRYTANVAVIVISLKCNDKQELTWPLKSDEKEVCLIAERDNQFGGVLRVQMSDNQANLSMLTSVSYFKKITLNGGNYQEHVDFSKRLTIDFIIDQNVQVSLHIVTE